LKILVVHQECFIPLPLSMNLLFKVMNIKQNVIAHKAGIEIHDLQIPSRGLRKPPETLKREMHSVFGMDVWEYKPNNADDR
jgi:hypothetical protein